MHDNPPRDVIGTECGQLLVAERLLNHDQWNTSAASGLVYTPDQGPEVIAAEITGEYADRAGLYYMEHILVSISVLRFPSLTGAAERWIADCVCRVNERYLDRVYHGMSG